MHRSIDNKLAQFVNGFCTDQVPLKVIYLVFFANLATKVASKVIYFANILQILMNKGPSKVTYFAFFANFSETGAVNIFSFF